MEEYTKSKKKRRKCGSKKKSINVTLEGMSGTCHSNPQPSRERNVTVRNKTEVSKVYIIITFI
jgi:hypothetical protein